MLYRAGTNWSIVATTKKVEASEGRIAADGRRGQDRSARRVDADLQRGVAHQPRLFLRAEHARGGLEGRARQVRGAAPARRDARRSEPAPAVDVERAVGRPSQRRRRRQPDGAEDRSRRAARRGLRRRERPLPVQETVRRAQLQPAASRAAYRAGRERQGGRISPGGRRQGPAAADERLQPVREHVGEDRRDHRRAERGRIEVAAGAGGAGCERGGAAQPGLGRGQPAQGRRRDGRARRVRVRAQHRRGRAQLLQALLLPAGPQGRRDRGRAVQRRRAASPTTTSTSCAGRSSATGRCATART